jgi:hypothetical protein
MSPPIEISERPPRRRSATRSRRSGYDGCIRAAATRDAAVFELHDLLVEVGRTEVVYTASV